MFDLFQCLLLFVQSFLLFRLSSSSVLLVNHASFRSFILLYMSSFCMSSLQVFSPLSYELVSGLAFSCARLVHRVSFRIAMLCSPQILGYFDVLLTLRKVCHAFSRQKSSHMVKCQTVPQSTDSAFCWLERNFALRLFYDVVPHSPNFTTHV